MFEGMCRKPQRHSRLAIGSERYFVWAIGCLLLLILVWLPYLWQAARPQLLTDPFLQAPTPNFVQVVWFTEFAGQQHRVEYGQGLKQQVTASTRQFSHIREDQKSYWQPSRWQNQTPDHPIYQQPVVSSQSSESFDGMRRESREVESNTYPIGLSANNHAVMGRFSTTIGPNELFNDPVPCSVALKTQPPNLREDSFTPTCMRRYLHCPLAYAASNTKL